MKTIRLIATAFASLAVFASCDIFDIDFPDIEDDDTIPILDGNTLTYGEHEYILNETPTEGTVTFTHFPATRREFEVVQNQLLGKSQPGTLALCLMSFEMYRRDRSAGQKCIEMCNLSVNAKQVLNNLKVTLPEERSNTGQSYLVASYLAGATVANKYQPDYPYKFKFTYSTSAYDNQGEESLAFGGHVYYWMTTRGGDKDYKASVIQLYDGDVLVHGCANYYLSAPTVSSWEDTLK